MRWLSPSDSKKVYLDNTILQRLSQYLKNRLFKTKNSFLNF